MGVCRKYSWLFLLMAGTALLVSAQGLPAATETPAPNTIIPVCAPPAAPRVDMGWYQEARYGLFLHWGLYSLTEGDWKGTPVGEFFQWQLKIPVAEMEAFAGGFNPTEFNAEEWVDYARRAGMKYLVITSKHSEGFSMFDSPSSDYNIVQKTPFGRDPLKELSDACERAGIRFCVYYSLGRDWADPDVPSNWPTIGGRSNDWDYPDEWNKRFERYFERKVKPQIRELLTQYKVHMLWFDVHGFCTPAQSQELQDMIQELSPGCLINDRIGNSLGDFYTPEQTVPEEISREPWESCVTIGTNWGYLRRDSVYKSSEVIARLLTDVVSKGGNLLFNVGPTPWGTFPKGTVERLDSVGGWLRTNGEAIYGTQPWRVFGESFSRERVVMQAGDKPDEMRDQTAKGTDPDIRFTCKPGVLYVIARSWREARVQVQDLLLTPEEAVTEVELLGYGKPVDWKCTDRGIDMELPTEFRPDVPLYVYRLTLTES